MKTILAIWHTANKGKTQTLREFANLLVKEYSNFISIEPKLFIIPVSGDFRIVIKINDIIIGVESKGDPHSNLKERMYELTDKFNCEIIVCSTRTRGETVQAVEDLANERDYQTIWDSTYQIGNTINQSQLNKLKAKHLLQLLQELKLL